MSGAERLIRPDDDLDGTPWRRVFLNETGSVF